MEAHPFSGFSPAWWLPHPHLQTVWGRFARSRRAVAWRREALPTPDGDTLWLDHAEPRAAATGAADSAGAAVVPRAILLHGLEGSSYSVYVQGLATRLLSCGIAVTALNFRSCALDPEDLSRSIPNDRPRLYHSGETTDLDLLVRTLAAREPAAPLLACGVSLGGNVLLKWLGEHEGEGIVRAAAALSVPFDLGAGARHLDTTVGRLYVRVFVKTLSDKAAGLAARFPEARVIDLPRARAARTFFEFDDAATAPLHGFAGAEDYWARSSSLGFVPRIDVPTLSVSAKDDPFLPPRTLEEVKARASPAFTLVVTPSGGHVGFVAGSLFSPSYPVEDLAASWLAQRAR